MENIVFKFTASNVDAIEQNKKAPIGNVISDNSIRNLAYIIEKAGLNEHGSVGMSNSLAMKQIDNYLETTAKDTDDLVLDITEALIRDGFLSRTLDVASMRELKVARAEQATVQIKKAIQELQQD